MKNKSFLILLAILAGFAALFIVLKNQAARERASAPRGNALATAESSRESSFRVVPVEASLLEKAHSPTKGPSSAKVTLVEFLDPECESCAAMHPYVQQITKEFGKELKVVVRYMPFHGNSKYVANILEGARAKNKFWDALDLLFTQQEQWASHHNPRPELIPEILKPLGLDLKNILADAKAGKYDVFINEDLADGKKAGVRGTPTFFVNGKVVDELGYEALKAAIENELRLQR